MKKLTTILSAMFGALIVSSCSQSVDIEFIDGKPIPIAGPFKNVHNSDGFNAGDTVVLQITEVDEIEPFCSSSEEDKFYLYAMLTDCPTIETDPCNFDSFGVVGSVEHGDDENHKTSENITYHRGVIKN